MTVVEKAAYLKGMLAGQGVEPGSKEGKLWGALTELLSDMAHEIEDLQKSDLDFAEALDDISQDLSYLEELTCDLDTPEDMEEASCPACCPGCGPADGEELPDEEDEEDGEGDAEFDGVFYDVTCPSCGEELSFDEDTLNEGSIRCPVCGELLEFDLDEEDGKDGE